MNVRTGAKSILLNGMAMILVGLLFGLAIPAATYIRLAVGAHIQMELHGLLFMVLGGALLGLPHSVGPGSIRVMVVTVWLTWFMALTEVLNSWWGTNQLLTQAAKQAGATGGAPWQEIIVKLGHIPVSLLMILSFVLLLRGFAKHQDSAA